MSVNMSLRVTACRTGRQLALYSWHRTDIGPVQDDMCMIKEKTRPFSVSVQGAVSIRKTVLPGMAIPMLKIRRPNGRLIFNMENAIRR